MKARKSEVVDLKHKVVLVFRQITFSGGLVADDPNSNSCLRLLSASTWPGLALRLVKPAVTGTKRVCGDIGLYVYRAPH